MVTQPSRLRAADLPGIVVEDPLVSGYELVNGELVPVTPAKLPHALLLAQITTVLNAYVSERQLGAVLVDPWVRLRLASDPERVRAPDVAFVSREKLQSGDRARADILEIVPDLVVEIFSPTNERTGRDFQQRVLDYLDAGVPLLWVIYPAARYATVFRADGSGRVVREHEKLGGESVLPGFTVPLASLFAVLDA